MSHDRGCPCGREKYEYKDCPRSDCNRRKGPPPMPTDSHTATANDIKRLIGELNRKLEVAAKNEMIVKIAPMDSTPMGSEESIILAVEIFRKM